MEKSNKRIVAIYVLLALFFIFRLTVTISKEGICKSIIVVCLTIMAGLITMYLKNKMSVEKKFLIIALCIGIILVFAIPILHGIDEVYHFYKAYSIFSGIEKAYDEQGTLMYKIPTAIAEASNVKEYADTTNIQGKNINQTDTVMSNEYNGITLYSDIAYITYWIPMLICQNILKMPIIGVVFIGRLFSFILWLLMSMYTIKIMPKRKEFIAFLCLMPLNLTLVTTFTGDLLTNSAVLLFIAYWYRLYEEKREVRKSEIVVISVLGCVSVCCKIVYALLFLLMLVLPKENFKSKKHKTIVIGVILLTMLIATILNVSSVGKDLLEAYPAIGQQKEWIFTHLLDYVIILFRTIITNFPTYLYQFTTGDNSMLHCGVSINSAVSLLYFIILMASLYLEEINIKFTTFAKRLIAIIVGIIICIIFTSLYLQWTATKHGIGYPYIMGVQGRYFFPIVALLALMNNKKKISIDPNYLWSGVILINFYILLRIIIQF